MRKGLTELVFVLDRSGSMEGLESDVIGGYNSFLNNQRKVDGQVYVSTVLFDDEITVLHNRKDIRDVKTLTEKDYYVGGCTALLDAVGDAIKHIGKVHKHTREEDKPEHVIFFINTDGYENASRKYNYEDIKSMIDFEKEKYNWEFIFMGANIGSENVASQLGINENRAVDWFCDEDGIEHSYKLIDNIVSCCRSMDKVTANNCMDELCYAEKKYVERRKK